MKKCLTVVMATALCGCATIIRGTDDEVVFESIPSGATVTAARITRSDDSPISCITPCSLDLSRKRDFRVTFELADYKPVATKLSSKVSADGGASFLGNAVLGGFVGAAVDAGTGGAQDLTPNPVTARLAPVGSDGESFIMDSKARHASNSDY